MTLFEFITAVEKYSADILLLALAVCLTTSLLKKAIPPIYKKYLTFAPFVFGCIAYAVYMYFTEKTYNVFSSQTVYKGLQCGALSTVYYVLFEQFIRGKKMTGLTDTKQLAVAGILKEIVSDNHLYSLSVYIAKQVSDKINDVPFCLALCLYSLKGKTLPDISETEICAVARLIINTLSVLK